MPYFSYCGGSWIHRRSYACVPRHNRVDLGNTPDRCYTTLGFRLVRRKR